MSELESFPIDSGDGIPCYLTVKRSGGAPVLLLHGASARHETFRIPAATPEPGSREPRARSLVDWLHAQGFEPWLLDWRGSARVVDELLARGDPAAWSRLHFDAAAELDVPAALRKIQQLRNEPIAAVAHCMGAGILAQAIASGRVPEEYRLTHVVLLTLGLFYEPPLDGRLKSQDHVLERLLEVPKPVRVIDPRVDPASWPTELAELFGNWPAALRPHPRRGSGDARRGPDERGQRRRLVHELCNRLSFMYGAPYLETNLAPGIHEETWTLGFVDRSSEALPGETVRGGASGARGALAELVVREEKSRDGALVLTDVDGSFLAGEALYVENRRIAASATSADPAGPELPGQFGAIPLHMYAQGARNARRGWAARWDRGNDDTDLLGGEAQRCFRALERVTLITGEKNQLWHRSGVDRMYEWLLRAFGGRPTPQVVKRVLPGYGHQDLLWGRTASRDVFPRIRDGIVRTPIGVVAETPDTARPRARRSEAPAARDPDPRGS